ncbi:MAG: PmoA family protein [Planctomycetaceae bacterium]|nr:PmoA family protein [Planctomycetaceae bacterium]
MSIYTFCGIDNVVAEFKVKTNSETNQWLILENEEPVLQYNYGTLPLPNGYIEKISQTSRIYAVPRSDYIHPLYDLDGEPITKDWSNDHPHHRGIYWAWPEVGYKNELGDLHALQKVFARTTNKIETATENGKLKLTAENVWKWLDKEPIVNEKITITVLPLDKNGRKINLEFHFTALVDEVTLARRGTQHYGGLNIRMQPLNEFKTSSFYGNEKDIPKINQPAWVCSSWNNPKSDGRTELTVFEKATNPDYPGALIQYPNLNWFQPTFPKNGTRYKLEKNKPLTLHYQLWLHNASDNDNTKKETWEIFQNTK